MVLKLHFCTSLWGQPRHTIVNTCWPAIDKEAYKEQTVKQERALELEKREIMIYSHDDFLVLLKIGKLVFRLFSLLNQRSHVVLMEVRNEHVSVARFTESNIIIVCYALMR